MSKFKKTVLMLCFILSGAMCYAHGEVGAKNENEKDGTPIEVFKIVIHGSSDKSGFINPIINGHFLTVIFTENIGLVEIEITTASGVFVETRWASTPEGLQTYVSQTGDYVITFKLSNGDEYYGEFTVSD